MPKYHISPDSGLANICRATIQNCPVGGEHFDNKESAKEFIEKELAHKYGTTASISKEKPIQNSFGRLHEDRRENGIVYMKNGQVFKEFKYQPKDKLIFDDMSSYLRTIVKNNGQLHPDDFEGFNNLRSKVYNVTPANKLLMKTLLTTPDHKIPKKLREEKYASLNQMIGDVNDIVNDWAPGTTKALKQ